MKQRHFSVLALLLVSTAVSALDPVPASSTQADCENCATTQAQNAIAHPAATAIALAQTPVVSLSEDFCRGYNECTGGNGMGGMGVYTPPTPEAMAKMMEDFYAAMPETITSLQSTLTKIDSKIVELEKDPAPTAVEALLSYRANRINYRGMLRSTQQSHAQYVAWKADSTGPAPWAVTPKDHPKKYAQNMVAQLTGQLEDTRALKALYQAAPPATGDAPPHPTPQSFDLSIASTEAQLAALKGYLAGPATGPLPAGAAPAYGGYGGLAGGMMGGGYAPVQKNEQTQQSAQQPADVCAAARQQYQGFLQNQAYQQTTGAPQRGTCGMTAEEIVGLQYYIGSGYTCMNSRLRGQGERTPGINALIAATTSAIERFPRYQGYVLRGASLPAPIRAQHTVGATVTYDAFTSTSNFTPFGGTDQFLIYSRTGRPIMTVNPGESEVLFAPGTRFKVLDVSDQAPATKVYIMREVGSGGPSDREIIAEVRAARQRAPASTTDYMAEFRKRQTSRDSYFCPAEESARVPSTFRQKTTPPMAPRSDWGF